MNFKGTDTPKVYVIDFQEGLEDYEYPLSGSSGAYVTSLLGSYNLLDKVRCANIPSQGYDIVIRDIVEKKPEVVISFGNGVINSLLKTNRKIKDISGNIYDININGFETKLLVLVSPTYIIDNLDDNEITLKFSKDLYKASQIINGNYVDILKDKEVLSAHSLDEFLDIYYSKFINDNDLAYDIETNARPPMMKGSKIIGFSIANKTSGVYVSLDSLDFHMSQEDEDKIWTFVINEIFEKKRKLIIHNTMYERPYTLYCKNYEISYDKADDTLVMARLLKSPKDTAGLKYQAQKYLGYPDWETDLSLYISGVTGFINRIGLGPGKFAKFYHKVKSLNSILMAQTTEEFLKLDDKDKEEIQKYSDNVFSASLDLYTPDEVREVDKLITTKIIETVNNGGVKDSVIPYNWIPDKMLSQYGAVDSLSTYDLRDYYFDIMDKESTDKVNLHKGYENWLEHMYVAYIMERNGMYWDEDFAEKDAQALTDIANKAMKDILLSPCFRPYIVQCCEDQFKPIILSDYLPEIAISQGYEVFYDKITNKYSIKKDNKRCAMRRIDDIQIPDTYRKTYTDIIIKMFEEKVNNAKHYDDLKDIYNPGSPTEVGTVARAILITPKLQMGGYITELGTLAENPHFSEVIDKLPNIDQKFIKIAQYCCDVDKLKENYGENWALERKNFFEGFCNLYKLAKNKVTTPEIKSILDKKEPVFIKSFDDIGVITIYNNMVVSGIDPDDRSTYSPEFQWMLSFRIFKKASKLISTYLDGVTGRASVAIVDKKSLQSGSHCVERKCSYSERRATSDEDYLLMSKWGPNTAETGRWRSASHTIPWSSQIKKYYSSRFVGGTTCCPDYSQMEVRTLGAVAHDENMLELFREDRDFHTETAKKIFRKDEVTPAERRYSKTATFSLLYGSSAKSFAAKYCNNDIDYANMIFNGFFEAYPKVKEWIEEKHKEVQRDHRVSLDLSNRFIPIVPEDNSPGELAHTLRMAQNYPIQGQSADLTGGVIFDLQKWIEDNNLKSLIFMYVHDSIEVDIYPYELLQFISKLKVLLNESPQRRMGLPSKADVALGKSLGDEIELKDIQMNEEMNEGWLVLKGYKDEIDETVKNWRLAYKTVEVSEEEFEDVFISMGELFILKKAYTPNLGVTRQKGKCKVHIKYYD